MKARALARGTARADLVALTLLGVLAAALLEPARARSEDKATRLKCANNLGQIAKGAFQYATDNRFYPHIEKANKLDGGGKTRPAGSDVAPRCIRVLAYGGEIDNPEVFLCPDSLDKAQSSAQRLTDNPHLWGWGGKATDGANPIAKAAETDKDADKLTDLSYGWTLKAISSNSGSSTRIAADRARQLDKDERGKTGEKKGQEITGNHSDGWNVVSVDATVKWISGGQNGSDDAKKLASVANDGSFLTVWDDATNGSTGGGGDAKPDGAKPDEKKPPAGKSPEALAVLALKRIFALEQRYHDEAMKNGKDKLYGTLADLAKEKLVDEPLASGKKDGYSFSVSVSSKDPSASFYATATPDSPAKDARYLYVNHKGLVYVSEDSIKVDGATCEGPKSLLPYGK
ncbi:hypothetical protein HY251_19690 [bacterium]|nr:hypothetical protein [bacterium]